MLFFVQRLEKRGFVPAARRPPPLEIGACVKGRRRGGHHGERPEERAAGAVPRADQAAVGRGAGQDGGRLRRARRHRRLRRPGREPLLRERELVQLQGLHVGDRPCGLHLRAQRQHHPLQRRRPAGRAGPLREVGLHRRLLLRHDGRRLREPAGRRVPPGVREVLLDPHGTHDDPRPVLDQRDRDLHRAGMLYCTLLYSNIT